MGIEYTNFDVIRGDTFVVGVELTDQATSGALDVTGWTVTISVKDNHDDDDLDARARVSEVLPDDADSQAGKVSISIPSTDMATLTPGTSYWYDVELRDPDGFVATIALGRLRVTFDVTRGV